MLSVCKERDSLLILVQVYPKPKNRFLACHTIMNETENQCSTQLYWKTELCKEQHLPICFVCGSKISSFLFLFLFIFCSGHDHLSHLWLFKKQPGKAGLSGTWYHLQSRTGMQNRYNSIQWAWKHSSLYECAVFGFVESKSHPCAHPG